MPLMTLSQVKKSYGAEIILDGVSLQLQHGEKTGLIGPNGSGKTTLLKIITGEIDPDEGTLHLSRGARIGYLSQEPPRIPSGTLRSYLEHPLRHIYALKKEIADLEEEIAAAAGSPLEERLERYANLTARFEEEGGYQVDSRLSGVARGLGFSDSDFNRDISSFSGGEKTRARLAGLLLQDLDLLLLDEPTNFLDLDALEWLEKYLRDLSCALVVVSHDRYFLDRTVTRIFALQGSRVKSYGGNYSSYQQQLQQELLNAERTFRRRQMLQAREERLVREAKADERSKRQARSRQKRLDRLEPLENPASRDRSFSPDLGYTGRSGRQVIIFDQVGKEFADSEKNEVLFKDLSFEIRWGDRVALVGPNGSGKSTLLKLISGAAEPSSGAVRLGPAVRVLYFDQEQEQLDPRRTLLETITGASDFNTGQARTHLGRYLFSGDDVFKQVGDLSGGEKSRLALARLALSSGNCLLMDEPTSHLDLPALENLEQVLAEYPGTLVIVSHDRYFLKGLANRVFEMDRGALTIYNRSFEEYLELKENRSVPATKKQEDRQQEKQKRQDEHRRRREEEKRVRRIREEQERLEKEIEEREAEIDRLEKQLSDPAAYGNHTELADLGSRLEIARTALAVLIEQWEETASRLES